LKYNANVYRIARLLSYAMLCDNLLISNIQVTLYLAVKELPKTSTCKIQNLCTTRAGERVLVRQLYNLKQY